MKWLPHETWEVQSPLDAVELALRLKPRLKYNWKWSWMWLLPTQPFLYGDVDFNSFHAHFGQSLPGIYHPRSVVEILGSMSPKDRGTVIHIRMRPSVFIVLFFSMWMGTVALFCVVGAFAGFRDGEYGFLILSGLMGAVGGILIPWIALARYRRMAPLAKELLEQLLAQVHDDAARNVALQPMDTTKSPPIPARLDP